MLSILEREFLYTLACLGCPRPADLGEHVLAQERRHRDGSPAWPDDDRAFD